MAMRGSMALLIAASVWAAPPEWAISGKSAHHPLSLWVVGAGSSGESIDLARQAAMADVVRQVKSRVKSTSEDERWEVSSSSAGNTRGESAWSGAKVQASEEIAGIQIAETAQDGKIWYALAVLERAAFAAPGRTAMREADADAQARLKAAVESIGNRRPLDALDALRQVEANRSKFDNGRDRAALGEPDALQESFSIQRATVDSLRREMARGFEFRRSIDSVEVGADRIWPTSAGLSVKFRGLAVTGLDVDLSGPNGQNLGTARTDSTGFAAVRPATVPATNTTGWSRWSLRPRLDLRPSAELALMVRVGGSQKKIHLDWSGASTSAQRLLVKNRLEAAGWSIDQTKGSELAAQLFVVSKGEVQGFSDALKRYEAKLVLTRGSARCEAVGVGTASTDEKAVANAIERINLPAEALRDLLADR